MTGNSTSSDLLSFLLRRRAIGYWLQLGLVFLYAGFCIVVFVLWVNPSLVGDSDQRIAADSGTYIYMADALHRGNPEPWVYGALASFPNTLWTPVFLAYVIQNTWWMAALNIFVFGLSIGLFRRVSDIRVGLFASLLLLNPTTTVSLLTVNKEIIDMLAIALFCFAQKRNLKWLIGVALILALLNRYEVCAAMLLLLFGLSRWNPLRRHRWWTLVAFLTLSSALLPVLASSALERRFEEASAAGLVAYLDTLEMHYLFVVAAIPKILEGMFGELLNVSSWARYSTNDLANSYILFFNNFAFLVVLFILYWKRQLRIQSDSMFFALLGMVLMSISLVIQPRYFYFCYVLFCFQAAQKSYGRSFSAFSYGRIEEVHFAD
ncbi:MAG TPA: hypothetical protein VHW46_06920 [Terracidiphilus sp.]|jgi:hypothetical protein|nr:hypothetical protein [Terracidiphilus sp.]